MARRFAPGPLWGWHSDGQAFIIGGMAASRQLSRAPQLLLTCAALSAMLVVVVHSVHAHMGGRHATTIEDVAHEWAGAAAAVPLLEHHDFVAECMLLELAAPPGFVLVLAAGFLFVLGAFGPSPALLNRATSPARPPPGPRRQALLGVFLS